MSFRFWLESAIVDQMTDLQGDQAHHATQVMRLKVGDRLELFDGTGNQYQAEITETKKKCVQVRVLSTLVTEKRLNHSITVATAIPKGDRQRFLVEKLVELGVDRLIPLKTNRSVALANASTIDRFRKWTIEACKQCQRNHLMEVSQQQTPSRLIAASENSDTVIQLLATPKSPQLLSAVELDKPAEVVVAIGPEGGFDSAETEAFQAAGWLPVSLSPFVLRIETAAIAASVLLASKSLEQSNGE